MQTIHNTLGDGVCFHSVARGTACPPAINLHKWPCASGHVPWLNDPNATGTSAGGENEVTIPKHNPSSIPLERTKADTSPPAVFHYDPGFCDLKDGIVFDLSFPPKERAGAFGNEGSDGVGYLTPEPPRLNGRSNLLFVVRSHNWEGQRRHKQEQGFRQDWRKQLGGRLRTAPV